MNNSAFSYLNFIHFSQLNKWYVSCYINPHIIKSKYKLVSLEKLMKPYKKLIKKNDYKGDVPIIEKISFKDGKIHYRKEFKTGMNLYELKPKQLLVSKINFHQGALSIADGIITNCSTHYQPYEVDYSSVLSDYLVFVIRSNKFQQYLSYLRADGIKNEATYDFIKTLKIPLPTLEKQKEIVDRYNEKIKLAEEQEKEAQNLEQEINKYIFSELGLKIKKDLKQDKLLNFVKFSNLKLWGVDKICGTNRFYSEIYKLHSLNGTHNLYIEAFRGKSPKYENNSNSIILNQKCNRWNSIDLNFAKTVSELWANSIDNNFKTQEGDILINSTGEGTIGRASCISKENIGLLYDSHILLLRLNKQKINPLYYTYLFNSCFGQEQIDFVKSAQSTKQTELGIDNLKKIKFPYPDMDVQNEIVDTITKLKAKIEKLNNLAEQNRQLAQEEFEKELFE